MTEPTTRTAHNLNASSQVLSSSARKSLTLATLAKHFTVSDQDRFYRPALHFTPPFGFMNDPNGLIFDGHYYHLYYQLSPFSAYAEHVHWGHAVSTDLYTWRDMPVAIEKTEHGDAFSGSVVLDRDNVSGLFPSIPSHEEAHARAQEHKEITSLEGTSAEIQEAEKVAAVFPVMKGGLLAFYTRSLPGLQTQAVAWSPDAGAHYNDYSGNPVLNVGSDSFRDPKVFWHAPTQKWVMVLVLARAHKVAFYGSTNLIHWEPLSEFGPAGLLGVDYECPSLVELDIEDADGTPTGEKRWVLFVSINPGAPLGGSTTQYFVGHFDGVHFTPDNAVTELVDFAKDNYALQTYNDMPDGVQTYIAWLSNWQYCEDVPASSWRGVMTLPRKISLRHDSLNLLRLVQVPWRLEDYRQPAMPFQLKQLSAMEMAALSLPENTPVELVLDVSVHDRQSNTPEHDFGRAGRFVVTFSNRQGEILSIGFDAASGQLWLDRGGLRGFSNPFFTDRFSTAITPGSKRCSYRLVLDGCTLELFADHGFSTGTALIYPAEPLTTLSLWATNAAITVHELTLYPLKRTMERD